MAGLTSSFRPTRDLDLISSEIPDPQAMLAIFRESCAAEMARSSMISPRS